jgi:hypothetical protein
MRGGGRLLGDTGHRLPQDRARAGLGAPIRRAGYSVSGGSAGLPAAVSGTPWRYRRCRLPGGRCRYKCTCGEPGHHNVALNQIASSSLGTPHRVRHRARMGGIY